MQLELLPTGRPGRGPGGPSEGNPRKPATTDLCKTQTGRTTGRAGQRGEPVKINHHKEARAAVSSRGKSGGGAKGSAQSFGKRLDLRQGARRAQYQQRRGRKEASRHMAAHSALKEWAVVHPVAGQQWSAKATGQVYIVANGHLVAGKNHGKIIT